MDHALQEFGSLEERFLRAQLAGDRRQALGVLDQGLAGGQSASELRLGVVAAAQREIGRLWQDNEISVAQEHLATAIAQLALAHLYSHEKPRVVTGRLVLVACVEGETHDMGARIAADELESAGFEVKFLGANLPTDSLVALAQGYLPDLIALSAVMPLHRASLLDAVQRVHEAMPTVPVVTDMKLGDQVPAHHGGKTAAELVSTVRRLLKEST